MNKNDVNDFISYLNQRIVYFDEFFKSNDVQCRIKFFINLHENVAYEIQKILTSHIIFQKIKRFVLMHEKMILNAIKRRKFDHFDKNDNKLDFSKKKIRLKKE